MERVVDIIKVFVSLCRLSQNFYGIHVFTSYNLSQSSGLSLYATRKALQELKKIGLVQNDCYGRPAVYSIEETVELVSDASPPIRGFSVTKIGRARLEWQNAKKEYLEDLRAYARGETKSEEVL